MSECATPGCSAQATRRDFCATCYDVLPGPTRDAYESGTATLKRVADMAALRRAKAKDVSAGRFSRIDYRH